MFLFRHLAFTALVVFGLGAETICTQARASSFLVTSAADSGGDVCGIDCTLRQAINAANIDSDFDAIVFDPTVFASKQIISLSKNPGSEKDLTILHDVSITGPTMPGSGVTILCNDMSKDSALRIYDGNVNLANLTFSGANTAVMVVRGHTTATNCTFSKNATSLLNVSYQRALTDEEEKFGVHGGLVKSVFGVVEDFSTLTANNCTFSDNIVGAYNVTGQMVLSSCTLTGNESGILVVDGPLTISNCLVVGNSKYNVVTSIGSTAEVTKDSTSITTGTSTALGLDPKGLQDNGGPTQTVALIKGSQAIGAGVATSLTDQRGLSRPETGRCDVGAFETQPTTPIRDS